MNPFPYVTRVLKHCLWKTWRRSRDVVKGVTHLAAADRLQRMDNKILERQPSCRGPAGPTKNGADNKVQYTNFRQRGMTLGKAFFLHRLILVDDDEQRSGR